MINKEHLRAWKTKVEKNKSKPNITVTKIKRKIKVCKENKTNNPKKTPESRSNSLQEERPDTKIKLNSNKDQRKQRPRKNQERDRNY
jgi:hypothetical protein